VAVGRERLGPALYLGGGLALVGAAGYAFVALTGHTLPPADAAAAASVYLMVNIIGPGLFSALEQETSRSVSAEIAAGRDPGRVTRNAAQLAAAALAGVVVLLLAVSPVLTDKALGGRWGLFAAVLLSVVTSAAVYVVRGLVGGRQRFTGYAATLGAEGVARILPCLVLALAGAADVVAYAVAFAAGSAFGALAGLPWLRGPVEPRPGAPGVAAGASVPLASAASGGSTTVELDGPDGSSEWGGRRGPGGAAEVPTVRRMARGMSFLAGGTLLMLLVANLAPIVVTPRLSADAATAAAFASAFVLARVPLFLFAPVQAVLLPALTSAATRGELDRVRATLRRILLAVAAVGVPGVVASYLVGPWAVQVLFGAEVRLPATVVGLLGVSTVGLMVGQVLQPGLVALGRHQAVTLAWLAGAVVLVTILALPGDALRAGVTGQLASAAVVVVVMLGALHRDLGKRNRAGQQ
jgi:O-antigen/teichoic acid export membrane protein